MNAQPQYTQPNPLMLPLGDPLMTDQDRWDGLERRLQRMERLLDSLQSLVQADAVQTNTIAEMQRQLGSLWEKYDKLCSPDGTISEIRRYQASCPRTQIKFLWWIVSAFVAAQLATVVAFMFK